MKLQCEDEEFGCDNGDCFPISKRCDEIEDCEDESDERNCDLVEIHDNMYRREYPPIEKEKAMTKIRVNISIAYIDQLDEIKMTFSVKIHVALQWKDSRVTFYNLKGEKERGNHVSKSEKEKLWTPALVFTNSIPVEVHIVNDDLSYLTVKLEGKPERKTSKDTLQKNEVFDGAANSLRYERYFDLNLRCNYVFENYPFDQQNCSITVSFNLVLPLFLKRNELSVYVITNVKTIILL